MMLMESNVYVAQAMVLETTGPVETQQLHMQSVQLPPLGDHDLLLEVRACGVCRTDLHIIEGDLPPRHPQIVPGHQIVGRVIERGSHATQKLGMRVGVSWLGGTDGTCRYCKAGRENLCDAPIFTGYDVNGGFATFAIVHEDFAYPLDERLSDVEAAPLLCAGIIGFRALRVAGVQRGESIGLFGFGSSAHLAVPVLQSWGCKIYVSTRGAEHRAFAKRLGVDWVGDEHELPPKQLDRAITFAPSGDVVVAALKSLCKGGVVAINGIHLDHIPQFDYDSLLWGEREIRSVTNMTRQDARDYLDLAATLHLQAHVSVFTLAQTLDALRAVKNDSIDGAAVIVMPVSVPYLN